MNKEIKHQMEGDEIIVGVTGLNASDNPAPGIGVAKSLKEDHNLNTRIYGLAYDAMEPGIYMDWLIDRSFLIPYPSANADALMERLLYIKHSYGLDVVVPTLDQELPFFIKFAEQLEQEGIYIFLPDEQQFRLRGKDQLETMAKNANITVPAQKVVNSFDELAAAATNIGFPVMLKGVYYKAYRAYSMDEAMSHFSCIVAQWGYPVIVQKVIPGQEMNVIGVGDGQGHAPGLVAVKKMSVTELGKIWTGVTVRNAALLDTAQRFVQASKWRGAFELECMVDNDDIYVIEINPRFPAWVYFATGVGVNLPSMLVRRAMKHRLAETNTDTIIDYQAGKLYIRHTAELVRDMEGFQKMVTKGEL